ncbi:MAG: hypothetical protein R3E84_20310 [Pseudomonadales bacterium]
MVNAFSFAEPEYRQHLTATIGISTTNGANSAEAVLKEAPAPTEASQQQSRNILVH